MLPNFFHTQHLTITLTKVIPLPKQDVINFLFDQEQQEIIKNRNNGTMGIMTSRGQIRH